MSGPLPHREPRTACTFGVLLQRSRKLKPTWTTVHLAAAALAAGHRLWFFGPQDVEITRAGRLVARVAEPAAVVTASDPASLREQLAAHLRDGTLPRRYVELRRADLVLLRLNPMDADALASALLIKEAGVPVVNDPAGVALVRSKAWLARLTDVPTPRCTVTRSVASARLFVAELDGPAVVKPALGSGGRGVELVRRRDARGLERAVVRAREAGAGSVVIQEYLPEADAGEKRLVWMDGRILGGYLRTRSPGDFRHNLRQGALPSAARITAADQTIAEALRPHLERNGIRIAGLDVIGDRLVEVNVLNPGGVHHASEHEAPALVEAEGSLASRMVRLLAVPLLPPPGPAASSPEPPARNDDVAPPIQ